MQYIIPLGIILLGVIALTIYVLSVALRDTVRQVTEINGKLLLLIGVRDGGAEVGRALVAASKQPVKPIPGLSKPEKKEKKEPVAKGQHFTVGVR